MESGTIRGQQPERREMRVLIPVVFFRLGFLIFKKRLKDIHTAKKKRHHVIRHQIKPLFLKFSLAIKTYARKSFQDIELPI